MLRDRLRVFATWLVCAWTAVAAVPMSARCLARLHEAIRRGRDTDIETLAHYRGSIFAEGIRRVRDRIPADAAYVLVVSGEEDPEVERKFVRFNLAPRRAVYVGRLGRTKRPAGVRLPELAVIARIHGRGPEVVPAASVLPPE
jgi:hypothetical protein